MNLTLPTGAATSLPEPSFRINWRDEGEVNTRQGTRHLYVAPIPEGWWDYWKLHKDDLKKQGFSCGKNDSGEWNLTCWMQPASGASKAHFSKLLLEQSRADKPSDGFVATVPSGVTPFPFQTAGVEYALKRKRCIIADDMGLGKTLQAIAVCNMVEAKSVLVVCPASLRLNWKDEWQKFATVTLNHWDAILSKKDVPNIAHLDVVFISYDLMALPCAQQHLRARKWDVIIADEAHYLKNKTTKRATHLMGLPPRSRKGTGPKEPIPAERYLFLTGTPVSNRPADFWNLLRFCAPEHFGQWTKYAQHFCNARRVPFGSGWDTTGASNLQELQALVRGSCMVRRLKKQVLTQLPAKTRKIVALPTPAEVIREIDVLTMEYKTSEETVKKLRASVASAKSARDAAALQEAVDGLKAAETALFTETSKVRKLIGLKKVDLAIDHIVDALEEIGDKVIVGAHHKEVVKMLAERLEKYSPVVVSGDTAPALRHERVKIFQNDSKCRVFIGNILAAGTGLTLTAAPHVIIVEPDWVPANNAQFEDRAHRIGQSRPVLIEYLAMERTIDVQVLRANARKMDVIEQATDNESNLELDSEAINYGPKGPAEPNKSVAEREAEDSEKRKRRMAAIAFGQSMSPRELVAAHSCVKKVAIMDGDHATAVNGVGFSKMDSEYGGRLARKKLQDLTDFEKGRVASLAWKYRRQCPETIVSQLKDPRKQP
jgi:SWI/SNF-related matrix-associated actin-dependent regulator 1 of chromatin subfamily A